MRILVCGGRDFDQKYPYEWFLHCMEPYLLQVTYLIHGAARGADKMAAEWAEADACLDPDHILSFPAAWDTLGRAAGPIRNQVMLDAGRPDLVLAFPGGRGTADMIKRAERQDILVTRFSISDYHQWKRDAAEISSVPTQAVPKKSITVGSKNKT